MAKKDTATSDVQEQNPVVTEPAPEESTDSTASQKNDAKAGGPPSGFYIYIGPTIRRLIQNGTIYRGNRAHALAEAQKAIEKYPLIKTLIVTGDNLPLARLKLKQGGNALAVNYKRVADAAKEAAAKTAQTKEG